MNSSIDELASLAPTCNAMSRKLDELTALRMAAQHMKTLRGETSGFIFFVTLSTHVASLASVVPESPVQCVSVDRCAALSNRPSATWGDH